MKTKILRFCALALVVAIAVLAYLILKPMQFSVKPAKERPGTLYWKLNSGSHIAYYHIEAKGEKKPYPVIYLQGGPGSPVYDRNIDMLKPLSYEGFEVYLYDQLGCGNSNRLEDISGYTVERHTQDLFEIIQKIGAEKVILIGQSWGSILATTFLSEHCNLLHRVILTGPAHILPVKQNRDTIKAPDSLHLRKPMYTNKEGRTKVYTLRAKFVEYCASAFNLKLASDKEMDDFYSYLNFEMSRSIVCDSAKRPPIFTGGSGYYSMIKTVQSFANVEDRRAKIKECTVPVLLMRGQCDWIKWGYVTEYLELLFNPELAIIPDAGHAISIEQPEMYIQTIKEYLN